MALTQGSKSESQHDLYIVFSVQCFAVIARLSDNSCNAKFSVNMLKKMVANTTLSIMVLTLTIAVATLSV